MPPTNNAPNEWIVDASVGIKIFIDGPLSSEAHNFFQAVTADPESMLYVPDLFYIECTNILWKYVRFQGLDPKTATEYIHDLDQLVFQRIPTASLMADALQLAVKHDISAYDASYVALAQRLDLPMITADSKLVNKLKHLGHTVRFLSDVQNET